MSIPITPRQLEILRLVRKDLTTPQIAQQMGIAEQTVKNQLYTIFQVFDVASRQEAVAKAIALGLLEAHS